MESYDFCVIGGGSGGLRAAVNAAGLGLRVCLVEKGQLGGDCLWTGCVPSKALLANAKMAYKLKKAHEYGFYDVRPTLNFQKCMSRVWDVIHSVERHDSKEAMKKAGVIVRFGEAKFISPHIIEAGGKRIKAKKFMISTGSRAFIPPIKGIENVNVLTNENLFHLKALPRSLIVVGGGPIGVEMAQSFLRLGSEVIVVHSGPHLLSREDDDLGVELTRLLKEERLKVVTDSRVEEIAKDGVRKVVYLRNKKTNKRMKITGSDVLIATGRQKNVELNLEAARVKYDPRQGIRVDKYMRTSAKHIFAAGDVTDCPFMFTHVADYHANIVVANVCLKAGRKYDPRVIPWVTYCDPELARVGLSEKEAMDKGIKYKAYKVPMKDVDRMEAEGETKGFIKILVTPGKGRLLGCHILAHNAGDLLGEFTLALKKRMTLRDIGETVHAYPTMSLVARQVTGGFFREKIAKHSWIKRLVRLRQWI